MSNITSIQLEKALYNTSLKSLAKAYVKAEETYGINAFLIVGITAQESSWGNSYRAKTQNNLSGYAVYSNMSRGATFNTKEESILKTAKLLKEDYYDKNLKDIWSINKVYCPVGDYDWANSINSIVTNDLIPKSYIR